MLLPDFSPNNISTIERFKSEQFKRLSFIIKDIKIKLPNFQFNFFKGNESLEDIYKDILVSINYPINISEAVNLNSLFLLLGELINKPDLEYFADELVGVVIELIKLDISLNKLGNGKRATENNFRILQDNIKGLITTAAQSPRYQHSILDLINSKDTYFIFGHNYGTLEYHLFKFNGSSDNQSVGIINSVKNSISAISAGFRDTKPDSIPFPKEYSTTTTELLTNRDNHIFDYGVSLAISGDKNKALLFFQDFFRIYHKYQGELNYIYLSDKMKNLNELFIADGLFLNFFAQNICNISTSTVRSSTLIELLMNYFRNTNNSTLVLNYLEKGLGKEFHSNYFKIIPEILQCSILSGANEKELELISSKLLSIFDRAELSKDYYAKSLIFSGDLLKNGNTDYLSELFYNRVLAISSTLPDKHKHQLLLPLAQRNFKDVHLDSEISSTKDYIKNAYDESGGFCDLNSTFSELAYQYALLDNYDGITELISLAKQKFHFPKYSIDMIFKNAIVGYLQIGKYSLISEMFSRIREGFSSDHAGFITRTLSEQGKYELALDFLMNSDNYGIDKCVFDFDKGSDISFIIEHAGFYGDMDFIKSTLPILYNFKMNQFSLRRVYDILISNKDKFGVDTIKEFLIYANNNTETYKFDFDKSMIEVLKDFINRTKE